jgi:cation diffusion facilitator family transporter
MTESSKAKNALRISLAVSALSLCAKASGFFLTQSTTALSDAAESVIHILAVAFVYYGFLLSTKPADNKHLYGHERVEFLSVGVEGAVIILAGITIIYESVSHFIYGHAIQNIGWGILLLSAAGIINFVLGSYLLKVGRREDNMMVVSNGKHTLTDVWTSLGAVLTLIIIHFTGWTRLDALVGFGLALYIMYEGYKLLRYSVDGLMDSRNPEADRAIRTTLDEPLPGAMTSYHNLRHRTTGNTTWIELHAIFQKGIDLKRAHDDATALERKLIDAAAGDVIVTIHLEPEGSHRKAHESLEDADQKRPLDDFI